MENNKSILITGAAGFIGSYLLGYLNEKGYRNIIIADDFTDEDKWFNFDSKNFQEKIERSELFDWLAQNESSGKYKIGFVFHLGARTDTTEFDYAIHEELNVKFSKLIWEYCTRAAIPLVYASSAATYGAGEAGYSDEHSLVKNLRPLNPYGVSKNEFDKWALSQNETPAYWVGLKFFNVYGPNEYHKERMASMVYHGYNQVKKTGKVRLFQSHKEGFNDGEQLRDFIYVDDIAAVCHWLMLRSVPSGLYNLGTGQARTFNDLLSAVFKSMGKQVSIDYTEMPADIRDKYQYFTEAQMTKLRAAGYERPFTSIEEGVEKYVRDYLSTSSYY